MSSALPETVIREHRARLHAAADRVKAELNDRLEDREAARTVDDFDTLAVDRELRKCCERWVGFRRALQAGQVPASDPFAPARRVLGRQTFYELGELKSDPIAPALRRWVYRLTEQRVNQDLTSELSQRLRREEHAIAEPEDGRFTLATMLTQGLGVGPKPALWLGQALKHTERVQEVVLQLWERRQELAQFLSFCPSGTPIETYVRRGSETMYGVLVSR